MSRHGNDQATAAALGNRIRMRRLELGLSQAQVAERADRMSVQHFGVVERGDANVTVQVLISIARALETSASQLMEGLQ